MNAYIYFCISFFTILLISSIFSKFYSESLLKTVAYLRFLFFPLSVLFLFKDKKNIFINFYKCLKYTIIILIFDSFFQFFVGENTLGFFISLLSDYKDHSFRLLKNYKVQSFFGDEGILGSFLSRTFFIFAGLHMYFNKNYKYSLLILYVLTSVVIILTGERVALLMFLTSTILIIFFVKQLRKVTIISFICMAMIFSVIISVNSKIYDRYIVNTVNSVFKDKDINLKNINKLNFYIFSKNHEPLIFSGIELFKQNILLGVGPGNFRHACKELIINNTKENKNSCNNHPHNYLIQIMSELGILGTIFYFFIFLICINFFIMKRVSIPDNIKCIMITSFVNFLPIFSSGNLFNSWLSALHFLPIVFILNYNWNEK